MSMFTFMKDFNPEQMSNNELVTYVRRFTPGILNSSDEDQIMYWEFIGSKLTDEQQDIVAYGISDFFKNESQIENFSQGIICLSHDITQFDKMTKEIKSLENTSDEMKSVFNEINKLNEELKSLRKNKKMC